MTVNSLATQMIRVVGLGKKFKIYPRPWGRAVEWLTAGKARRHDDFWALRDVSFSVGRGESLGVIGVNGSGKSTLLKILSGALYPTQGEFQVGGRVLSLLELGTGVNPELTGRQNVVNSSRLLAFPPGYAEAKMAEIEAFAELSGGFFDRPVKLYSSGMMVRLAFSMFACFDPDVFVVDEALSVGDVFFQQKCARRLQAMRQAGTTMLFVSHDLMAVEALCDRILLLHGGEVAHLGDKMIGIRLYYAKSGAVAGAGKDLASGEVGSGEGAGLAGGRAYENGDVIGDAGIGAKTAPSPPPTPPPPTSFFRSLAWQAPDESKAIGNGKVRVTGLCFRGPDGSAGSVVEQGQWLEVFVRLDALSDADNVNGGVAIYDRFDRLVFARGWLNADVAPMPLHAGQRVFERFCLKMDLEPGEYSLALAAAQAMPRADAPGGWDQDLGGERYTELKHAAVVSVLPRRTGRRHYYGPSRLESEVSRVIVDGDEARSLADVQS